MQIDRSIAKGQLVALTFGDTDVAASQTDVQLLTPGGGAGYTMPFPGEIIAVTRHLSAAAAAGSMTLGATIGGTELPASASSVTTQTSSTVRLARSSGKFVAGAEIGAEITTSGTWDGTAADLTVLVFVLLYLEGI